MNRKLLLKEYPIDMSAVCSTERPAQDRLVLTLTSLGMIASVVAFLSFQQAFQYQLRPDEFYSANIVKSQIYYVARATEITLLLSAGLVAFLFTNWQAIERGYLSRFALLLGVVLLMTARGYSLSDLFSTKLADASGPCPFFMSLLVFIGACRRNWNLLGITMVIMAALFSALTLAGIAGLHTFTRQEGVAHVGGIVHALYWPASWIVLKDYPQHSLVRCLRFVPIVIFGFGSLFTQTRLLFVMLFALFVVYSFVQRRRRIPQATVWFVGVVFAVWVGLFTNVFLKDTRAFEKVAGVADAFSLRLTEDTRTGQLVSFAESVRPSELLLGKGSFATWQWGRQPWVGVDVGYISLLFFGGVPLLVTYVVTHVKPCLAVLRERRASWQLAAAGIVLLWAINMFSSCYPDTVLDYYPVLFCVGACISREPSP